MPRGKVGPLAYAIQQETGKSAKQFAEEDLKIAHSTFCYRARNGGPWFLSEINIMLKATGKSYDELFGSELPPVSLSPGPVREKVKKDVRPAVSRPAKVEDPKVEIEKGDESAPFVADEIDLPLPGQEGKDF